MQSTWPPYGFQSDLEGEGSLLAIRSARGERVGGLLHLLPAGAGQESARPPLPRLLSAAGRARRTILSGQAVSAVSRTVRRSEVISQVLLRDELGRYSTALENEAARGLQILRRRCMDSRRPVGQRPRRTRG